MASDDNTQWFDANGWTSTISDYTLEKGQGIRFKSGGKGDTNTVAGGQVQMSPGSRVRNSTVTSGHIQADGGTLDTVSMTGGSAVINAGTTLAGTISMEGSSDVVIGKNGQVATSGTVNLNVSGGTLEVYQIGNATINMSAGANVIVSRDSLSNLTFNGVDGDYSFDIADLDPSTILGMTPTSNQLIIHTTNGDITIKGNLRGYQLTSDGHGGTTVSSCFAEGTLIETPDGERPVEELTLGSYVSTHLGPRQIKWLGSKRIDLRGAISKDDFLVRIRANAFETGRPKRDLWITPEHCVLAGGKLIPVRMLVNGASIAYDLKRRQFTYYHFALDDHAVIMSEGLPSESYLMSQTNRDFSATQSSGDKLGATPAFPFVTEISEARKIWQALAERSAAIGIPVAMSSSAAPARRVVRVRTDLGTHATLKDVNERHAVFSIPAGTKYVVVESDAWRPDQIHGPYWDDRRHLGVRVGAVRVSDQQRSVIIDDHLNETCLGGWNNIEDGCSRWTNGKGIIPLARAPKSSGRKELELTIAFPDREEIAF
ncbi:Hint domain-containing protein [Candidatus Kirkpatrickella diaphorinae]|uniref:Hint domain-containing protein n=1 Tax=Candidatus Kirkpatrickella diaphorinae TaxID=2984322 RepID=A0ABY6GI70_9PROT|nr:Hint domain-containing protein [Candidatus Kirkpatrickella diaphorinae]UYH51024.1 Hint domain-containing protein [Candidatus Kirkpatrickella diaphorinae]